MVSIFYTEEYQNEFMGPLPSSRKGYRYSIADDTYVEADEFVNIEGGLYQFYVAWDRQTNTAYNYTSGEGVGNKTPIKATNIDTGEITESPDYGYRTKPHFSPDNSRIAVLVEGDPVTVHLFKTEDIESPYQTLTLSDMSSDMIYTAAWSHDNSKLAVGFDTEIYLADIESETSTLLYTIEGRNSSYLNWERNYLLFSPEDTYLVFADFSNSDQTLTNLDSENDIVILTSINLETLEVQKVLEKSGWGYISG